MLGSHPANYGALQPSGDACSNNQRHASSRLGPKRSWTKAIGDRVDKDMKGIVVVLKTRQRCHRRR